MKKKIEKMLDQAFYDYDFGDNISVVAQSGWENDGSNDFIKVVFVEINGEENSEKVSFHAIIENDKLKESYAFFVKSGNEVGISMNYQEEIIVPKAKLDTKEVLAYFRKKYPTYGFNIDSAENLGVIDCCCPEELVNAPKDIIYFNKNCISMWDVYASDCSRFIVLPSENGLSEEDGKLMLEHNKVTIHGVYEEVMSSSSKSKKNKKK